MKISQQKKDKISEQILAYLYSQSPRAVFTAHIAFEVARDEEFIKKLLKDLKKKKLITEINKNSKGVSYLKRIRWKLSEDTYILYKHLQNKGNS